MTRRVRRIDEGDSVYTFCPPCYQTVQKQATRFGKVGGIFFLIFCAVFAIVAIIVLLWMFNIIGNMPTMP